MNIQDIQKEWISLIGNLRKQVEKRISHVEHMPNHEIEILTDLLNNIYWLEVNAHLFEKKIDLEMSKNVFDND